MKRISIKFIVLTLALLSKVGPAIACNCGSTIGSPGTTVSALGLGINQLNGNVCLYGTFIIDQPVLFDNLFLELGDDASIIINNGKMLTITASRLRSCDQLNLWRGISLGSNSTLIVSGSEINDAEYAVQTSLNSQVSPTIQIDNSIFNKNYISIDIKSDLNSTSHFNNVNFTCEDPSHPGTLVNQILMPRDNGRSYIGFQFSELNYFDYSSSLGNNFINIECGIRSNYSGFKISNSFFLYCGYGVYLWKVKNLTNVDITSNNFETCKTGIYAVAPSDNFGVNNLNIINNSFLDFTEHGIILKNSFKSHTIINSNLFNYQDINGVLSPTLFTTNYMGESAIYVTNNQISSKQDLQIGYNSIANTRYGIYLQNIDKYNPDYCPVYGNEISLQIPLSELMSNDDINVAVKVENCRDVGCCGNTIHRLNDPAADYTDVLAGNERYYIAGIYYLSSTSNPFHSWYPYYIYRIRNSYISSNIINHTSNSVSFKGSCLGVGVVCNQFNDGFYGVTLGELGPIIPTNISKQPPIGILERAGDMWNDGNCASSDWRVHGVNASIAKWNHTGWPLSQSWNPQFPTVDNCTNITPNWVTWSDAYCSSGGSGVTKIEIEREELLGKIVRHEESYDSYEDYFRYQDDDYAFNYLRDYPALINIGASDDAVYQSFYDDMVASNHYRFYKMQEYIDAEDYTTAYAAYQLVIPTNDFESYLLDCYGILFDYDLSNVEYDNYAITRLQDIAHMDYMTAGDAVFMARGMLELQLEDNFDVPNFTVNVWLEGFYNTSTNEMVTALSDIFPGDPNIPSGSTDYVTISLYDDVNCTEVLRETGILNKYGRVSVPLSNLTVGSSYWIRVEHRNHANVWSAYPISESTLMTPGANYSFKFNGEDAYSPYMQYGVYSQKELEPGAWGMFAGDIDQDDGITSLDMTLEENAANIGAWGYIVEDLDGDGAASSLDMTLIENNSILGAWADRPGLCTNVLRKAHSEGNDFESMEVSVYPNPGRDNIKVVTQMDNCLLKIANAIGEVVYEEHMDFQTNIKVANFPKGIYFLTIERNGSVEGKTKIVLQ